MTVMLLSSAAQCLLAVSALVMFLPYIFMLLTLSSVVGFIVHSL